MKYINKTPFNNGIRLTGQTPLDDRTVINSKSELHITTSSPEDCPLYNKAYEGLSLSVADENYETYICIDATPYTPGKVVNVKASNLATYWKRSEQTIYDYVHGEVDTYIRTPHIKVNSQWVKCTSTLSTTGIKGIDYVINASIDNDSLKVTNDILAGYKYKLYKETLEDSDPLYAAYKLQYKAPGATDWANDPVRIEIPKISVVKSVRLCKAVPDSSEPGNYRVIVYRDECTEQQWDDAEGEVFLRIVWDDDEIDPAKSVTYLNVGEIIQIDIKPLEKRLDSLESSTNKLEVSTYKLEVSTYKLEVSIGALQNRSASLESSVYTLEVSTNKLENRASAIEQDVSAKYVEINTHIDASVKKLNETIDFNASTAEKNINDLDISAGARFDSLESRTNTLEVSTNKLENRASAIEQDVSAKYVAINTHIDASVKKLNEMIAFNASTAEKNINDLDISAGARLDSLESRTNKLEVSTGALESRANAVDSSLSHLYVVENTHYTSLNSSLGALIGYVDTTIKPSINELSRKINDISTSVAKLDTSLSNLYVVENTHYTSLNSSLSTLKTYVDTTVNSSINELARKIDNDISTAVASLGASITELRNYVDTSLNAAVSALDASIKSLKSYVDVTITNNINDISTRLANNVQTINGVVADLSTYAHVTDASQNASIGVLDASTKHLDVSMGKIYDYYREQTGVWAGAWDKFVKIWNQFRSNNPSLNWNNVDTFDGNEAIIPN